MTSVSPTNKVVTKYLISGISRQNMCAIVEPLEGSHINSERRQIIKQK